MKLDVAIATFDSLLRDFDDIVAVPVAHETRISFDFVGECAAQESGKRQPRNFTQDIPESDIDSRNAVNDRTDAHKVLKLEFEVVLCLADLESAAADHKRLDPRLDHQ